MVDRHTRPEARGGTCRSAGCHVSGGRYGEPAVPLRIPVSRQIAVSFPLSPSGNEREAGQVRKYSRVSASELGLRVGISLEHACLWEEASVLKLTRGA